MAQDAAPSTLGVRELRRNLPRYLDRVKKGEALTITKHGAAVALLSPVCAATSALDRLVAAAWRPGLDDRYAISRARCPYASIGLSACVAEP